MTPRRLVLAVLVMGVCVLGVIVSMSGVWGRGHASFIIGSYVVAWVLAIPVVVSAAVVAQASMRKRHGVFSHLKQSSSTEVTGGDARAQG